MPLAPTHLICGSLSVSLLLQTANPIVITVGAIASLLPDIDSSQSWSGRMLSPVSYFLERRLPHRSCTHSVLASLIVACITYPMVLLHILPISIAHSIVIGYSSGWFVDLFSKQGVQATFPSRIRWVVPANRDLRLATGSTAEYSLLTVLIAITLIVFYINSSGGIMTHVNEALGTSDGIVDLVRDNGAENQILISVEGVKTNDNGRVKAEYELIENQNKSFIVRSSSGVLQKLCSDSTLSLGCTITAERMVGRLGKKSVTEVQDILLSDDPIGEKLNNVKANHQDAQIYLSGKVQVDDSKDLAISPHTGGLVTLKKSGSDIEFEDCPISEAINVIGDEYGTGSVNIRIITLKGS